MKSRSKKTPNAQRRTPNIEWRGNGDRAAEIPDRAYGGRREYDLEGRLLEFAASIVELVDSLPNTRAANHIGGQLLRCGTSPLSNHGEVEAAESRKDFLHKLRICLKELRETRRWLLLVGRLKLMQESDLSACLSEGRAANQNLPGQRSHDRKQREMILRSFAFGIGRSTFSVRRLFLVS